MTNVIQINHLKKSYGNHVVLQDLNFSVNQGEIFAILGVNGAGKTTALECMEGLKKYDSGTVSITDKTGIQLQSSSLPEHMKAAEAIRLFAKWNETVPDEEMLNTLGIYEFAKKQYYQLSTGQKRRLHLALSLVRNPDILFLDEPTAGLDVEGRISLHKQFRRLKKKGKTIILASHDMAEVESLCDRIAILNHGRIAFVGTVEELNETIGKRYQVFIQTEEGYEKYETDDIGNTLLTLLKQYQEAGRTVLDLQVDRGSLEQYFMEIAKGDKE